MVTVIEKATGKVLARVPVGIEPEGLAVSKDGKTVIDVSKSTSMAHFTDTQNWKVVSNVLVDTRPRIVGFTPDERKIWVTSEVAGTVSVMASASRKVSRTISFDIPGMRRSSSRPRVCAFPRMDASLLSHWGAPTTWRPSIRQTTRSKNTCWSGGVCGSLL